MAAGVAVLTSNTTSIPEVVSNHAVTVDPLSIQEIADGMLLLLGSESVRQKFALSGSWHAKSFDWVVTAQETFNFIQRFK